MHFILSTLKLGPAKKSDLLAVLKDVLPDVLTDQQNQGNYQIFCKNEEKWNY